MVKLTPKQQAVLLVDVNSWIGIAQFFSCTFSRTIDENQCGKWGSKLTYGLLFGSVGADPVTRVSRRDFLRGRRRPRALFRPPWAGDEALFSSLCSRCDACIPACPEGIVYRGDGGYPELEFGDGGCSFCRECLRACETGALVDDGGRPWSWLASIGEQCLATRGITCRSCGDACQAAAIRFRPVLGGRSEVELDPHRCNGCGDCIRVCPEGVIELRNADFSLLEQNPGGRPRMEP